MKRVLQMVKWTLVSYSVGFVLKLLIFAIGTTLETAIKMNFAVALFFGTLGFIYLLFSYGFHRFRAKKAATEADRISSAPNSTEADWGPLRWKSQEPWKQSHTVLSLLIGLITWSVSSLFLLLGGTKSPDVVLNFNLVLAAVGNLILGHAIEERECVEFEKALNAANAGHWFPKDQPIEDRTAGATAKKIMQDLPDNMLEAIEKGIEEKVV